MKFHIVLPNRIDLAKNAELAAKQLAPRHAVDLLAKKLDATVHQPDEEKCSIPDKMRAKLLPPTELWSLARKVHRSVAAGDVVFCASEAGGFQIASMQPRGKAVRLAMFVHNVDRPRARFALKLWNMSQSVDLFLACSTAQVEFLQNFLNIDDTRAKHLFDHTDTKFFTPGPASKIKKRPLVVSVGLERRDYKTLAAATSEMNVDVSISGFSKDAAALRETFPKTMPENMSRKFYEWPELVQLYRDADAIVVSCFENKYAAGVQSLMEAAACEKPVVVTATKGLSAYINEFVYAVKPGDVGEMRSAIKAALTNKVEASARAKGGREFALQRFDMGIHVAEIAKNLRSLSC
jgi:glycosyltransferase involved in cell wall biosynthesis